MSGEADASAESSIMKRTEMYDTLLGQGIQVQVSLKLDKMHQDGLLLVDELDDRALEALKEFSEEEALHILEQFTKSDLSHVHNKSAFLCGVMKTYRAKMKTVKETPAGVGSEAASGALSEESKSGPSEEKMTELLERTGYTLDITTGQRKYGGPPPEWEGAVPGTGEKKFCSQIFIGKLPQDMYEDELVPILEPHGTIYDLRIMVDPFTGLTKGFAFCTFTTKEGAQTAVKNMDKKEVRDGRKLGVCLSQANNRLFVGSIPKSKTKKHIFDEFAAHVEHLCDVIVYISSEDKSKNRGFAFLEFESHKDASLARRRLMSGRIKVFGNITPTVDWADPIQEPDEDVMSKVKVVYVRNLSPAIDDTKLNELFKQFGSVEKVKKIKDYAFIHFVNRDDAVLAIEELDGHELDDLKIEVSLAKPQVDKRENRSGMSGFGALNRGRSKGEGFGFRGRGRGGYGYEHSGYGYGYGYQQQGYKGYQDYGFEDSSYNDYYGAPSRGRGRGGPPRGIPPRGGARGRGDPSRGVPRRGDFQSRGDPRRGDFQSRGDPRRGDFQSRGDPRRGGPPSRGDPRRGGPPPRGAPRGAPRGGRGVTRGAGLSGAPMLKRKAEFNSGEYGQKRKYGGDGWGTQPIAQQPLAANNYYSDDYGGQEWYSDSYGQDSYGQSWN